MSHSCDLGCAGGLITPNFHRLLRMWEGQEEAGCKAQGNAKQVQAMKDSSTPKNPGMHCAFVPESGVDVVDQPYCDNVWEGTAHGDQNSKISAESEWV